MSENAEKNTCSISTEASTHTRRCFMTGEYCSQKTNIQRERKKLYKKGEIVAFVIMNFSDMSDVVYKWRIEIFIESLRKYLYVDDENGRLYCNTEKNNVPGKMRKVEKIKVVRSDSNPASNYVICSRICQQIQIADLVVVDVSTQNPNVFYEFGMAVALQKLILPICFSESFYKAELPKGVKKQGFNEREKLQKHIGCYPWRKALFEYYGIRFKQNETNATPINTEYAEFEIATNTEYGFSDEQYCRFPYDEKVAVEGESGEIGQIVYEKLENQYNSASKKDNTLVVYTMEHFLNEDQAGLCIVNFFYNITQRMQQEHCFCGDRVGVLVQGNVIPDSDKDAKKERHLLYNVGEIIHIGVNQATYLASKEKVQVEYELEMFPQFASKEKNQVEDELKTTPQSKENMNSGSKKAYKEEIQRFVKEFIGNRGMIIHPNNPIYVERIRNQVTSDVLEDGKQKAFCLYHVMLRTLRFTNEIVVDITGNNVQSLFWLGAAHGAEIYAITVKHELSKTERKMLPYKGKEKDRNVFDVAGLWTAYYYSYDTEGFYHQLALAQFGIEKHSKIIPADKNWQGFKKWEYLKLHETEDSEEDTEGDEKQSVALKEKKKKEDRLALESYYRSRFWNTMLRYNRLCIYVSQRYDKDKDDDDPRLRVAKWDLDAISALSNYLSKRSVIGEYNITTLPDKIEDVKQVNFICVGQPERKEEHVLPKYINDKLSDQHICNHVHMHFSGAAEFKECRKDKIQIKGFGQDKNQGIFTYLPWPVCYKCFNVNSGVCEEIVEGAGGAKIIQEDCPMKNCSSHIEIAQLILWKDDQEEDKNGQYFRVSVIGSSGPATYAISSIFVDEEQKYNSFMISEDASDSKNTFLFELQQKVRRKIFDLLMKELKAKLEEILHNSKNKKVERYIELVLFSVYNYLNTVLYRYFLPFLTEKDLERIRNGMFMCLNSMKVAKQSPFCLDYEPGTEKGQCPVIENKDIKRIIEMIPNKVKDVLEHFKGLEAFYEVEVEHINSTNNGGENDKDERKIKAIRMFREEAQQINYFIFPPIKG